MREKTMIARERLTRWEELLYQADCAQLMGATRIAADIDLLQEIDRYVQHLHEEMLKKTVIVGFACDHTAHDEIYESGEHAVKANMNLMKDHDCDHCGHPVSGAYVKTAYGMFHSDCHGAAQRNRTGL